ncbi:MAG TPA: hypothetical protein VLC07_01275 [Solirubrobacterales bacterium]|nr:hypothetical protein [Solirubrobacterales bacterium]
MILGALVLLGFGIGDLVALLPLKFALARGAAATAAVFVIFGVAALSGMASGSVALTAIIAAPAVGWVLLAPDAPEKKHAWLLLLPIGALLGGISVSGSAAPVEGDLAHWYEQLPFGFVSSEAVPADQFVLGVGAFLFLLATSNQIVRLVLATTDAKGLEGSELPKGGRLLGPMERLIVAAALVAGDPAGAGFVVAAKGLLRFPEVNRPTSNIHELTEYLLVGTFTSISLAISLTILVLASS